MAPVGSNLMRRHLTGDSSTECLFQRTSLVIESEYLLIKAVTNRSS